jgi:hypothetical protein
MGLDINIMKAATKSIVHLKETFGSESSILRK